MNIFVKNVRLLPILKSRNFCQVSKALVNVQISEKSGVATVIMNNPPVNAMTMDFMTDFCKALDDSKQNNCKGIILTSAMKNVFTAGLNIQELLKPDKDKLAHYYYTFQECWYKLYSYEMTTIAAINGHSPAGGCVLSLSTDYRIMKSNLTIGLNESAVGIVAPVWVMKMFKSVIPPRQAEKALILGHLFSTEEALKYGVIDEEVTNNEDLFTRSEEVMSKFNKIDAFSKAQTKIAFRKKFIDKFLNTRQQDVDTFVANVMNPRAQAKLEEVIKKISKK